MELSVSQILQVSTTRLILGSEQTRVHGCSIDTRTLKKGDLFVAFPGERVDGNAFVSAAARAGAACVVMTRDPLPDELCCLEECGCATLVNIAPAPDPEAFMLSVARLWRSLHPDWIIVGITGSVGKTTTKEMCAHLLRTKYRVHATSGNYNSNIGVALTVLEAPESTELLVVEMGMNKPGEILAQSTAAHPNLAVITNIGTSHIGMLGSREAIAHAKAEILSGLTSSHMVAHGEKRLFMSGEDDFVDLIAHTRASELGVQVSLVGTLPTDELRSEDVSLDDKGRAHFRACYADGERLEVFLKVPGAHIVQDALFALAVAENLGCDREQVTKALSEVLPVAMRLQVQSAPGRPRVIDDSYNASPASMAGALDVLSAMTCSGRKIAVLGEIGELGDDEERLHELVGAYVAGIKPDLFVAIGSGPACFMVRGAKTMGMSADRVESFPNVERALSTLLPILREDDLILVKASRAAQLDTFVREVLGQ